ncbi:MAG: diguanylate cyclase [FCB group bacterium]|nr:diguanylate cyclase [FCB group bacterium]
MELEKISVLLVEDEPVARKIAERMLQNAGYRVKSAENGKEAWKLLSTEFFPIIITDWLMPEMDGVELCKLVRANEFPGYIFIVLLTSMDSQTDIIEGLESGADDYLTKPVDKAELIARLKTATRILELETKLKKANEEITQLSITDPLTGIYNRGHMVQQLTKELIRSGRYNRPYSIVLGDIDHFKKVNDTYGHLAGDTVIRGFVNCLRNSCRKDVDQLFRYGGEEFIISLPETTLENALLLAERIRKKVSEEVIYYSGTDIRITASFGVAGIHPNSVNSQLKQEAVIKLADEFLYKCKKEGRNKVAGGYLD